MWHVDEGALHAYLDGALDEYPAAEARRVREHLETCRECGDRLAAERLVREEAEGILGLAAPRVDVPTFEELRAYVRSREPTRTTASIRLYRLGWAASVLLALGTGWLLRGGGPPPLLEPAARFEAEDLPAGAAPVTREAEAPASVGVEETATTPTPATTTFSDAVEQAQSGPAVSPSPAAAQGVTPVPDAVAEPRRELVERDDRAPQLASKLADASPSDALVERQNAAEPVGPPAVADDDSARTDGTADVEDAAQRRAVPEQRLTSAITPAAPLEPLGAAGGRSASADLPGGDESTALVVPGLEVLGVLPVGQGTTFAGMRALQRLETGDTLEIVHLSEGVDPASLPPLREGWRELALPRGSGWLVMRAPVTEAALLDLLQRLETGR